MVNSGTLATKDGLTLRLTTDLGSVRILQLEAGAAPVVRYTVHIETNAHGPAAQQLGKFVLKARPTNFGVELAARSHRNLPTPATRSSGSSLK